MRPSWLRQPRSFRRSGASFVPCSRAVWIENSPVRLESSRSAPSTSPAETDCSRAVAVGTLPTERYPRGATELGLRPEISQIRTSFHHRRRRTKRARPPGLATQFTAPRGRADSRSAILRVVPDRSPAGWVVGIALLLQELGLQCWLAVPPQRPAHPAGSPDPRAILHHHREPANAKRHELVRDREAIHFRWNRVHRFGHHLGDHHEVVMGGEIVLAAGERSQTEPPRAPSRGAGTPIRSAAGLDRVLGAAPSSLTLESPPGTRALKIRPAGPFNLDLIR